MPNWCLNHTEISTNDAFVFEEIKAALGAVEHDPISGGGDGEGSFVFSIAVPLPDARDLDENYGRSQWMLDNWGTNREPSEVRLSIQCGLGVPHIGYRRPTGGWRGDSHPIVLGANGYRLSITYMTAWGPAEQFWAFMAKRFPRATFFTEYEEPLNEVVGILVGNAMETPGQVQLIDTDEKVADYLEHLRELQDM